MAFVIHVGVICIALHKKSDIAGFPPKPLLDVGKNNLLHG